MPLTEWQRGQQVLTGTASHWFDVDLGGDGDLTFLFVPYTTQYGSGIPPWTVTLASFSIDSAGDAVAIPVPVATYATGFNFQTAVAGLANDQSAVFWTSAHGSYPASNAVDINARQVDATGTPVGPSVTLLSNVSNLYQFRVASAAYGGTAVALTYSTYDATSHVEQIDYTVFGSNGAPLAGQSGVLDSFTSAAYDAYGFGTLTDAGTANPGFIYLRGVNTAGTPNIGYETIGNNGATSAFTTLPLDYSANSTNRQLLDWNWGRLAAPAGGYSLTTAALISDVAANGAVEHSIDVRFFNPGGGASSDDLIGLATTSTTLSAVTLANGGVVVGYTDLGTAYLREYDNQGDVVGLGSLTLPHNPSTFTLDTLADGRLLVTYPTGGGTAVAYDIYTLPTGPIAYDIDNGVTRSGIALASSDNLTVEAGGTAVGTTTTDISNGIRVLAGGASRGTVLNGGTDQVLAGATSSGTVVNALGDELVITGAVATGTVVNLNGQQGSAGTTRNTVVNNGAYQFIQQAGIDQNATLNAGGNQWLSGKASGTMIAGGSQLVEAGAVATAATLTAGSQDVIAGALAVGTTIKGGVQYIEGGGTATQTIVGKGGTLVVLAGGTVNGATVAAGGTIQLRGDGSTLASNGTAGLALNGGTLVKTADVGQSLVSGNVANTVAAPGLIETASGTLELGGTLAGPLALRADAGTTLILDKAASAGTAVSFAGAKATLQLNDATEFRGTIAGFARGQSLDLRSILDATGHVPTLAYAAANGQGTLTVSDGTHAAALTLSGSYAASGFHLASDGHGGSLLTYG